MIRLHVAGLMVGLVAISGCSGRSQKAAPPPPPSVTVCRPAARQVTDYFEFPGQTEAVSEVAIRARVTGYIVKVNFDDGQAVKKGQVLFEIDPRPYRAILDRARAEVARLEAVLDKAEVDVARSKRLRPSGAVSEDEHEQHLSQVKIAKASLASAKAAVDEAELNHQFTNVVAPIDGRVSSARIREGNLVQGGSGDSAILTTVVTTTPIYVCFNVDEQALLKYQQLIGRSGKVLNPGRLKDLKLPVEIGLLNEKGFPHRGVLDFTDNKLDRTTGTIRVRGVFRNNNEYLTPGLFVRVRIPFGKPHQVLFVSERAIHRDQKLKYVLTVDKKNNVVYRQVEVGTLQDGMRAIESGIVPDDLVIVQGLQRAKKGVVVAPHFEGESVAEKPGANRLGDTKKTTGAATTN
ncbi:MAG: efflux RND transporter periplasmic adaptor subunit [Thermoguttaceae bacterium]